jgi:hypothetical protein
MSPTRQPDSPLLLLPLLALTLALLLTSFSALAAEDVAIPPELRPWIPWVLHNQEVNRCTPQQASTSHLCAWPSPLLLDVTGKGAEFSQTWHIETRSLVPLPGNAPYWPEEVRDNNQPALVSKKDTHPALWLEPGTHTITGTFRWRSLPEYLIVPPLTGLIKLTLEGKHIPHPQLDQQGKLWLQQKSRARKTEENKISLQVFRKIRDNIPLTQELVLIATVSGLPRPITLGLVIDSDFVPLEVFSPLPIHLNKENKLTIQARPGQWQIRLTLRNTAARPPERLNMGTIDGLWPDEEIWVVEANAKLRQLDIQGVTAVDPSRTALPEDWKSLPAYLLKKGDHMILVEKSRGASTPNPNRLNLHRRIWLDEQGTGLTIADAISGTMTRGWRLNVAPELALGRVEVDNTPRLITRLPGTRDVGVEVRQGKLSLQAVSRIESPVTGIRLRIPAVGWDHSVQQLSAILNLPPGWSLLTTTGVDKVATWLNRWTLLDLFLVMIISLATARVLGWPWGAVALLTLALSYHQPGSPRFIWLPLLALLGMHKVITAKAGEQFFRFSALAVVLVLIIMAVPYMIREIRVGIYPQLELGKYRRIIRQDVGEAAMMDKGDIQVREQQVKAPAVRKYERAKNKLATYGSPAPVAVRQPAPLQVDPHEMIQTGPGQPLWSWKRIPLSWNGPVTTTQNITLYLLSPAINTILAFVRVLLLFVLVAGFLKRCLRTSPGNDTVVPPAAGMILLCLAGALAGPPALHAEIPSQEILGQLQERLLEPPDCGAHCAQINRCQIQADADHLRVELSVDVQSATALPLPGKDRFFTSILDNGAPAEALRHNRQGYTLIRLSPGRHTITLARNITNAGTVSFVFPVVPEQGQALLEGWSLNGLRDNGLMEKQLTLRRLRPAMEQARGSGAEEKTIRIPAFVQVERTLQMGLKWTTVTRIVRRSPGTIIALDIPLLPGEHVTTESMQVHDRKVRINMGPRQKTIEYSASLDPVDTLILTAPRTTSWTETWFLDVSPIWHVEGKGIPAINQTDPQGNRYPEYRPYPGEQLVLGISRPEGIEGPVMTINQSRLTVRPGLRATDNTLAFTLTASRGRNHTITLPGGIDLQRFSIDGKEIPLQLSGNSLRFPVHPGKQKVEIRWRSNMGIHTRFSTEQVNLGMKSVNASTEMEIPSSRWILLTSGPRIGPAVLFWGELLVFLLIALMLGRVRFTPLTTLQWLLLSLGLSQIPAPLAAVVVAWLLLLGLRKQKGLPADKPLLFNLGQVFLVILTLAALGCLFAAIQKGLLGHPDMQIGGNGSTMHVLRWYQDRVNALLPAATVVTVPLLVYRISMLVWALWLAMALLRWLRWGWDCFTRGGGWQKRVRTKKNEENEEDEEENNEQYEPMTHLDVY